MWAFGLLLLLLLGVARPQPHMEALNGGSPATLAYAQSLLQLPSSQAYVSQVGNPSLSLLEVLLSNATTDALQEAWMPTQFTKFVSQAALHSSFWAFVAA